MTVPSYSAGSGEPDAQFDHAVALLRGEQARVEGPRAVELIERAAAANHAEAVAMSALFEAIGALRPQDWSKALDQLARAAELGSRSAQAQLMTLQERGCSAPAEPKSSDWRQIRASLSVERLLNVPVRRQLSDLPRIVAFPGFMAKAECDWIIGRTRDRLTPARVFSRVSGDQDYDGSRDNSTFDFQLPDMDVVTEVIRVRISAATRLPVPIFEPIQILHYSVGQQFLPHCDYLDPAISGFAEQIRQLGQRIATVLVYMNDDYTGGETVFPKLGLAYRGEIGDALFFTNVDRSGRGDPRTMHAGTPPQSGEKWVFSQWIRDRLPAQ